MISNHGGKIDFRHQWEEEKEGRLVDRGGLASVQLYFMKGKGRGKNRWRMMLRRPVGATKKKGKIYYIVIDTNRRKRKVY